VHSATGGCQIPDHQRLRGLELELVCRVLEKGEIDGQVGDGAAAGLL